VRAPEIPILALECLLTEGLPTHSRMPVPLPMAVRRSLRMRVQTKTQEDRAQMQEHRMPVNLPMEERRMRAMSTRRLAPNCAPPAPISADSDVLWIVGGCPMAESPTWMEEGFSIALLRKTAAICPAEVPCRNGSKMAAATGIQWRFSALRKTVGERGSP
jgi:hypothetical protein